MWPTMRACRQQERYSLSAGKIIATRKYVNVYLKGIVNMLVLLNALGMGAALLQIAGIIL
jgi:hypothetical protein